VSGVVRELLLERGVPAERIHLLPNRVDLETFKPALDDATLKRLRARYPGRYRVLHVGRKSPEKNLETLIRALALLSEDHVGIFVGQGDEEPYRRLAAEVGIADRCHFVPAVANDELPAYYTCCDCMCTPSRSEGFGIVFIEALACQAVVVTSDLAPMNEMIRDRETGLLVRDFEDPAALARTIERACTDTLLRVKLRARARAAAEPFGQATVDRLEADLYERFLAEAHAGTPA
jgi:glycosyltransferase involved in cell wall biosynthesis